MLFRSFVMLFIPVEPAFMMAIAHDPDLYMEAWSRQVLLVSPSTLLFVLRTVEHLWRQEAQSRNAQDIASRGAELYDKLVGFVEDLDQLGERLRQAQTSYDKARGKFSTGRGIADVHVAADEAVLRDRHTKGYFVAPIGPAFDNPAYNRKLRVPQGTYFESNAFVVAFGWNKDLFNGRINDYPDLLNPAFTGRIGVPNPSSQALVDFYMFLEQNFGADFEIGRAHV
mgnify:CR=1 FL=1